MNNSVVIRGKQIIIPFSLQKQILHQLHSKHMVIEKVQLLIARESVYWININTDIEHMVK